MRTLLIMAAAYLLVANTSNALAAGPDSLSFQGLLTNLAGDPIDADDVSITFTIYKGVNPVWTETQLVDVVDGIYNVFLGEVTPLGTVAFDQTMELGVKIDSEPSEIQPRIPLVSTAFARALPGLYTFRRSGTTLGLPSEALNIIAGENHTVGPTVVGATIGGGGATLNGSPVGNSVLEDFTTIGGGYLNSAGDEFATVAGGRSNNASGGGAFIGGGSINSASATSAVVVGGQQNQAGGLSSFIGSGQQNLASGSRAFVGAGLENSATAAFSVVAGGQENDAQANYVFVGGGLGNAASGVTSIVSGGYSNTASADSSTIAGGARNEVTGTSGTIGGGTGNVVENSNGGTVAGGEDNRSAAQWATVGGGHDNVASAARSTVAGGGDNDATGLFSTISGGVLHVASGETSTIGGGYQNTSDGRAGTVPGGFQNRADGIFSFAAGFHARADNNGSFVWQDSTGSLSDYLTSTHSNEFLARASGGVTFLSSPAPDLTTGVTLSPGSGAWAPVSDVASKTDFEDIDAHEILDRLAGIPIQKWRYRTERSRSVHLGPTAQDFYEAFGLGPDERHIVTVDADGVALAAIQALHALVKDQQAEIERMRAAMERAGIE